MSFLEYMGTDDDDDLTVGQRDNMKESLMSTNLGNLCVLIDNRNLIYKHYHHPCSKNIYYMYLQNLQLPKGK